MSTVADCERVENGFSVRLYLLPELRDPRTGLMEIVVDGQVVDALDVTPERAYDAYAHTTLYSDRLREYLSRGSVALPEIDGDDEEEDEEEEQGGGVATEEVDDEDIPF